jgi:hypothetical protein
MSGANDRWIIKLILPFILFGLPSFLIILKLYMERNQQSGDSKWSDLPRQTSICLLLSYMFWWGVLALNRFHPALAWATGFAVLWPVLGALLSLLGCGLAFLAGEREKAKLLLANVLFLALSLSSIIAPN